MSADQRPHICFIRRAYTPYGGAERYLSRLIEQLHDRARVSILCQSWPQTPDLDIQRIVAPPFWRNPLQHFRDQVSRHLRQSPCDLSFSLERTTGQHIYRAGDGVHREWLRIRERHLGYGSLRQGFNAKHRTLLDIERDIFNQTPLLIANSRMVKRQIMRHYNVRPGRVRVIYNGVPDVDRSSAEQLSQSLRQQHQLHPETAIFTYVGSGFERKGAALFIRALASVKGDWHAFVVGQDKHLQRYRSLAAELGLAERISFPGAVDDPAPYYAAASLFVLPTYYDPFANTCLEAAAWGVPVLTSVNNGASELFHNNGTLRDFRAEELGRLMQPFLDPDHARIQGQRAHAIAMTYTLERNVRKTLELIEEGLNRQSSRKEL